MRKPGQREIANTGARIGYHGAIEPPPLLKLLKFSSWLPVMSSEANAERAQRTEQSKSIQEPQDDADNHDGIEDRLDGTGHRNESVNQSKQNTNHDQRQNDVD